MNLDTVGSLEVIDHISSGLLITMVKNVILWVHVPLDLMDLVGSMWTILSHDDSALELTVDEIGVVSHASFSDQGKAMIN